MALLLLKITMKDFITNNTKNKKEKEIERDFLVILKIIRFQIHYHLPLVYPYLKYENEN